jgi:hypothetical protein
VIDIGLERPSGGTAKPKTWKPVISCAEKKSGEAAA